MEPHTCPDADRWYYGTTRMRRVWTVVSYAYLGADSGDTETHACPGDDGDIMEPQACLLLMDGNTCTYNYQYTGSGYCARIRSPNPERIYFYWYSRYHVSDTFVCRIFMY